MLQIVTIDKINSCSTIKKLILDVLKETGFSFTPKHDKDLDNLKKYYYGKGKVLFVLLKEHDIIGTIAIEKQDNNIARLKRFYLKKEYRGKGLGNLLYKKAEDYAKSKKISKFILNTTVKNKQAILFFQKHGFLLKKQKKISLFYEKLL
jgi:putative acetyltransferase